METPFTLILAILSIESSYLDEVERPAQVVPDTVQFWMAPDSQWRIRTFAIDHDIHVHKIQIADEAKRLTTEFAKANIEKTYGDVTAQVLVIVFEEPSDPEAVKQVLERNHLKGQLEAVKAGYYFYNPDSGNYRTRSQPKPVAGKKQAEQGGAEEPATRAESDSEAGDKPQPESEERSR